MLAKARLALDLFHHLGLGWLAYRAWYAAQQRLGWWERKCPVFSWAERPLSYYFQGHVSFQPEAYLEYRRQEAPAFLFSAQQQQAFRPLFVAWDSGEREPVSEAEALAQGRWPFFGHQWAENGFPPDWQRDPFAGVSPFPRRHWSRVNEFGDSDIKLVWETSRFGFVYTLVRAYWRTGDERYVEWFWQLVTDWMAHNLPNRGVNWKCGQEISLRVMACCFGLYGFLGSEATCADRVWALVQLLAASGQRIEANLPYALSQRNNHGISEGMGLWTLGTLFPELEAADRWEARGRDVLESLAQRLIYEDGSFSQHSVNYHRLMLHDYLWCVRLAEIQGRPFSAQLKQRIALAGNWLCQLQVGNDGQVPMYGQVDGALILPLNNCDFQDFRPVIQTAFVLTTGERFFDRGPWDEDLLWLFGPEALVTVLNPSEQQDLSAKEGGYYTIRTEDSVVFTRCGALKDRPAQADMLHVDLWYRGYPVAIDAGTYSYHASPPWNNSLAETQYHNCVTVDGLAQMKRASRFLWLPWVGGKVKAWEKSADGAWVYWQGSHNGYVRSPSPVRYRRGIARLGASSWLVVDDLQSHGPHEYRLHWLLADWPFIQEKEDHLVLRTPAGDYHVYFGVMGVETVVSSLVRADKDSPRGWHAPYYFLRCPALSVDSTVVAETVRFWTCFAPEEMAIALDDWGIHLKTGLGTGSLEWAPAGVDCLPRRLVFQEKERVVGK